MIIVDCDTGTNASATDYVLAHIISPAIIPLVQVKLCSIIKTFKPFIPPLVDFINLLQSQAQVTDPNRSHPDEYG